MREDEYFKNRLPRGTRSPMRPSHTAWQLLLSLANKRRFQRQIQEADLYRTSAIHKTNLIARRLRNKPHNARAAQLPLSKRRLGIESSSKIVQQGTTRNAHRSVRLLAAQFEKL